MKNSLLVIASAMLFLQSCSKDEPTVNNRTEKDIYVTGYYSNGHYATYWKNGIAKQLTDSSESAMATSIFVSGNDVYVAGQIMENVSWVPVYWKNGERVELATNGSQQVFTNAITVSGGNIYVAGFVVVGDKSYAVYWKNSDMVMLDGYESGLVSLAVSGNDVYVAGGRLFNAQTAVYFKNGNAVVFSEDTGAGSTAICVVGSDVYLSGASNHSPAIYWKNGVETVLESNPIAYGVGTGGIAVSGNDVYVCGYGKDNSNPMPVPLYWMNGVKVLVKGGEVGGELLSIAVSGKDVYTTGVLYYDNAVVSKVWKNEIPLMTLDSLRPVVVSSIFVAN